MASNAPSSRPNEDRRSPRSNRTFPHHAQQQSFSSPKAPSPQLFTPRKPVPEIATSYPWHRPYHSQHRQFQPYDSQHYSYPPYDFKPWSRPKVSTGAPSSAFHDWRIPRPSAQPKTQVRDDRMTQSSSSSDDNSNKSKKPHKPCKKRHHRKKTRSAKADTSSEPEIWDPYVRLGVLRTATDEEIIAARRRLAVQYHPDRLVRESEKERKRGQVRFQEISEAFAIVGDRWMRAAYDQEGRTSTLEDVAERLRKAFEKRGSK